MRAHKFNEGAQRFEEVIVEAGIARVVADEASDVGEAGEDEVKMGERTIAGEDEYTHDAAHEKFVFLDLFGGAVFGDESEELTQHFFGQWKNAFAGNDRLVSFLIGQGKDPLNRNGTVGVYDIIGRAKMLD